MYLRKIILHCSALFIILSVSAQNAEPVVATVGNTPILKSEFEYAYNKSRKGKTDSPEQFLQSYINLKLKIEEARNRGIDKSQDFKTEYDRYLEKLTSTYLEDTVALSLYAKKIYDRRLENIEIDEIFVPYTNIPVYPKDTLETYLKIKKIESELVPDGSNFSEIAKKYRLQQEEGKPRVDTKKWITSFVLESSVEDVVYNMNVNEVSSPVRSNLGYHLVKVLDRHDDRGEMNVSHILFIYPGANATQVQRDSVAAIANQVYKELEAGANFEELCKQYSSDVSTSSDGGVLGWFGILNPLPELFNVELEKIEPLQTTPLIQTPIGYVILKLNARKYLAPWEKAKKETMGYILDSPRKNKVTALQLEGISKQIPSVVNDEVYTQLRELANVDFPDTPSFAEKAKPYLGEILVTFGTKGYTVADFINYINQEKYRLSSTSIDVLADYFDEFVLAQAISGKKAMLYTLYPGLINISQEYYDGLMTFEITNEEVWDKSVKDKQGLQRTFEKNPKRYKWNNPKFDGYLVHAKNKDILNEARQFIKEHKNSSSNLFAMLKDRFNKEETQVILEKGLWGKGDNEFVDNILYGTPVKKEKVGFPEFSIEGETVKQPRTYQDVRGQVIVDYQSILEKEWIDSLRKRYNVVVYEDVLNSIK